MVSICITTFNRKDDLKLTVERCLQIDSDKIEVIVCDNCSDDGTREYLSSINDDRFRYIINEENIGPAKNFVKAIKLATKPYAFLLNDKDSINIDNLTELVEYLCSTEERPPLIYCNYKGDMQVRRNVIFSRSMKFVTADEFIPKCVFLGGYISEVLYNMNCFHKIESILDENSYLYGIYSYRCIELAMYTQGDILLWGKNIAEFRNDAQPDTKQAWMSSLTNSRSRSFNGKEVYWTIYSRNKQMVDWVVLFEKIYGKETLYKYSDIFINYPVKWMNSYLGLVNSGHREKSKWSDDLRVFYEKERKKSKIFWFVYEAFFLVSFVNKYFSDRRIIGYDYVRIQYRKSLRELYKCVFKTVHE